MAPKKRIGILGIGAIGTVIACHLQQYSNYELFYFSRTKKEFLNLITSETTYNIHIDTHTSISELHHLDWLVVCLKAHQYEAAKHWFPKLISPRTKVVVIRNGLRLKQPILPFTSKDNILDCIIDCPTEQTTNTSYKTIKKPLLTIPESELATKFEVLFKVSKMRIHQVKDFKTESWKKLCESATLGAILCLHNDTCHIFKDDNIQKEYEALMAETIKVAIADGADIERDFLEKTRIKILNYPDTKGSSMLCDFRNGNPIEFEAKNGIISQLGKLYHIETPLNNSIINKLS